MYERISENPLPSYDNEQARQFYRSATNPRVLPKKYWPVDGVEFWEFNTSVIEQYTAAITREYEESRGNEESQARISPEEVYLRGLARAARAAEYVKGRSLADISDANSDNELMQKEGAREYVLRVARGGAREIKRIRADSQVAIPSEESAPSSPDEVSVEQEQSSLLEVLPDYVDLGDTIRRLYQEERVLFTESYACELFLLFRLVELPDIMSDGAKQAVVNAAGHLRFDVSKIRKANIDIDDPHFQQGLHYIEQVSDRFNPLSLQSLVLLKYKAAGGEEAATSYVHSHVAYALDKMYTGR